jgi:uncharacterized protein
MKKILLPILFLFLVVLAQAQIEKILPEAPNPPKLVVDYTNTLTADQVNALESKLKLYDDSTSNQLAVVLVQNTGIYEIADYAYQLGRKWGVGNKEFNNGIVILVSIEKHQVFIATGTGLEGAVPDMIAKQIIESSIVPNFKGNDYYSGLNKGTDDLIASIKGEYKAPPGYADRNNDNGDIPIGIILFLIIFIILSIKNRGGGSGSFMSRRGYTGIPPIIGFPLGGGGGSDSSDSGGGSFGGFGGGGFSGGGAGGSW